MKRVSFRKLRRAQSRQAAVARLQSRKPRPLGVSLARFSSALAVAGALFASVSGAGAATYYWDADQTAAGNSALTGAGLGNLGVGPFVWDLTSPSWWLNGGGSDVAWTNGADNAVFTGTGGAVTLGEPITVGGVTFASGGYSLNGSTLTFQPQIGGTTGVIAVNNAGFGTNVATISSLIAGTAGLAKTGDGTLYLTNNSNTFSGDLAIKSGTVVVTNAGQLGSGTTAISVTGTAQTGNPGFSGGSLVLHGSLASASGPGLTFSREISIAGRGVGAVNSSGALVSVGNNTITGDVTLTSPVGESRIVATHGTTTLAGGVHIGASQSSIFRGNGNFTISGLVAATDTATDRLIKSGDTIGTTLWLTNVNNNFANTIRVDSGTVRVNNGGALGRSVATNAVDLNNATLEVRTDAPTSFAGRTIAPRNNTTGTLFLDHAAGSLLQSQTVTFGDLRTPVTNTNSLTLNVTGRNGYGASFTAALLGQGGGDGNTIISNNANGTVFLNGNFQGLNTGNSRTITFNTNTGEIVVSGNIVPGGATATHQLTKGGTGTLVLNGTASTYTGVTNINAGTLVIGNVGAVGTGAINLGTGGTPGALTYTGGAAALGRTINLNSTTAQLFLNASGTGALTISSIANTGAGAKTLFLGGTNTADNTISSVLANNAANALSLQKIGGGTWVLAGTADNTLTGGTIVSGGILRLQEAAGNFNVLPDAGAITFGTDTFTNNAGGTLNYVGAAGAASAETVGALTLTAGAGVVSVQGTGTGTAALTFASLAAPGLGSSLNIATANGGSVAITGATNTNGILNPRITFNGADFAANSAVTAATYIDSAASLAAGNVNPYRITGSFTQATATVNSGLKFDSAQTITIGNGNTLTLGGAAGGGIIVTGGVAASIANAGTATGLTTGANAELIIRTNTSGDSLSLGAPVINNGTNAISLTKTGAGTLILSGANTYSGTTTINEGTVQLAGAGTLGATNANLTVRQGATLDLNGVSVGALLSSGLNAFNSAGTVTNTSTATAILRVGNNAASGYVTGPITGAISLAKGGSGTLSLTNNTSNFTSLTIGAGAVAFALPEGVTTMNAGVPSPLGLGASAASLVLGNGTTNGTLQYTGANGTIFSATGSPSFSTDRLFTMAGNATLESLPSIGAPNLARANNNASIVFSNTGAIAQTGSGTRLLTLTGDSTGDNTLRPQITDNGTSAVSLTKAGTGLWVLSPGVSNTYTGETTVSAGILQVPGDAAPAQGVSASSLLTINGGVLQVVGDSNPATADFTRTLGSGPGNVRLNGGVSGFAAATHDRLTVNLGGGTLTWGSANFNPTQLVLGSANALGETEIANNIDLAGAARTITVNNNGTTGTMVTAGILSGVISNTGSAAAGFIKAGNGVLILGNSNTYNGNTQIDAGNLVVTSIGTGTSSSLGASGALVYNAPAATDFNGLFYVGAGEVANRNLVFQGANASDNRPYRIDASGSGPLVWNTGTFTNTTRSTDTNVRTLTLDLRGSNVDNNQFNLQLTNSTNATAPSILAVSKEGGGVWVLNPPVANTFTGSISANGGLLGLTANGIGAASAINLNNGGIFAFGGPLTINRPVQGNNSTGLIVGQNNILITGEVRKTPGDNDWIINNNLENGAVLTVDGNFVNQHTANSRTINIRGTGSTVWNGSIQNPTGTALTGWNIAIANDASFTFGAAGTSTSSFTGTLTLSQGTLILNRKMSPAAVPGPFQFNGGVLQGGTVPITGVDSINNPVLLNGDPATFAGSQPIEITGTLTNNGGDRRLINNLSAGLTLAGQVNLTNDTNARTLLVAGTGTTTISGAVPSGTASNLDYRGTGVLNLTAANATGTTTAPILVASRGTVVIGGAAGSWGGNVVVNPGATLSLDNSAANLARISGRPVTLRGGTLSMTANAAGSTETAGALTINNTQGRIQLPNSGTGTNVLTFASVSLPDGGSALSLAGIADLGATNQVRFTAAPAATGGILPRFFLGGSDFAAYNPTNGVVPFTGYAVTTDVNGNASTATLKVDNTFTNTAVSGDVTLNALAINGSGLNVSSAGADATLALTSGAVLNAGGANTLSVERLNLGANAIFQTATGSSLTLTGSITSASALTKGLGGELVLSSANFYNGATTLGEGRLKLGGGNLSIFPGVSTLLLNPNSELDLNGSNLFVANLNTPIGVPSPTAVITSSTGAGTIATNAGFDASFSGAITGANVNYIRVGGFTTAYRSDNTFGGTTTIMGGNFDLREEGRLSGTSAIVINYGRLRLLNNNDLQIQNNNRVNDTAPITLRGGSLQVDGRVSTAATETFGALTLDQGANVLSANVGGGTISSVDLTFASLARTAGSGATINFTGTNLGQQGNNARIVFSTPPAVLGGGVLGAWAIANQNDFAAYNASVGVGVVGQGGFTGYDGDFGSGKITLVAPTVNSTLTLPAGTTTAGLLRLAGAVTNDIAFTNPGDTLNLEWGGILRSDVNNPSTIGTPAVRGVITSGNGELIVYNAQNTVTINSVIDGAGTRLVKDGAGTLTLTADNNYTGDTIVNRGTLNLSGGVGVEVIPGNLIINGAIQGVGTTVTMVTNAGQIAPTSNVTINGRSTLNLAGASNTLASVRLNSNGGDGGAPTLALGGTNLTLTSTTPFTAESQNAPQVAAVSGAGSVLLTNGANTIDVGAISYASRTATLNIGSVLAGQGTSTSITKTGAGLLQLSAANTFAGGATINAGGLILGASSNPIRPVGDGTGSVPLVNGPVGTGSLTVASGASLFVNNASQSLANPVTFAGDLTFDSTGLAGGQVLSLNGALTTPNAVVVGVNSPFLTANLAGQFTNAGAITSITKNGLGNLNVNLTGVGAAVPVTANNGGSLGLLTDGDGDVQNEVVNIGAVTVSSTIPTLTIGRAGQTALWNQAANKIVTPASLNNVGNGLILTNNNGYQLSLGATVNLTTPAPTFSVANANNSNSLDGLVLAGLVTGGATAGVVFSKAGAGTLALTNAGNDFGAPGAIIDVTGGILSGTGNGSFGNTGNIIRLSANSATQGLRLAGGGNYTLTGRTINLNAATVGIDVAAGTTATLDTPFTFSAAANALQKNDLGTLVLTASNSGRTGTTTIASGVLQIENADALGSGQIIVNNATLGGAALWLAGGITINNPIQQVVTGNGLVGGINSTGGIFSASGVNTINGTITNSGAFNQTYGVANGSTLNFGASAWNSLVNSPMFNTVGNGVINLAGYNSNQSIVQKFGTGTLNLTGPATTTNAWTVGQGTFNISGAGQLTGTGGNLIVQNNGVMNVDDTTGGPLTRLGGTSRTLNLANGTFNYTANGTSNSAETLGALTSVWGGNTISLNNSGTSNATLTFASLAVNGGSIQRFNSAQTFNATTNRLVFTTAPGLTNGLIQRAVVTDGAGVNFATHGGAATPIVAFSAYSNSDGSGVAGVNELNVSNVNGGTAVGINASVAANTLRFTGDTVAVSNPGLHLRAINALKIEGANTDVQFATSGGVQLALGTGNILATDSGQTIGNAGLVALNSAPAIFLGTYTAPSGTNPAAFTSAEGGIMVAPGANLTVNAALYNTQNVTKGLDGNLTFATKQYFNAGANYFTINGGTVTLAGGENTLWQGVQGGTDGQRLAVGPGATLNLGGNAQMTGEFRSPNATAFAGSGGVITGTNLFISSQNQNSEWGGSVQGSLFFNKAGGSSANWRSDNTYTGGTLINGATLTLIDEGRISGSTSLTINNAALTLSDAGTVTSTNRVNDAATISLRGGAINLVGRAATNTEETLGAITLEGGLSTLSVAPDGSGAVRSAVLNFGNLTQNNYSTVLAFTTPTGQMGTTGRLTIANGSSFLINGIIPWLTNGGDFMSYVAPTAGNTTGGLAALNAVGYQGYDAAFFPLGTGSATQNLRPANASFIVPSSTAGADVYSANAIAFVTNAANQVISFADNADTLNITSGGLTLVGNNAGKQIGSAVGNGRLTVGGSGTGVQPFYLMVNQGSAIVNSAIVDNGAGGLTRLVYTPMNSVVTTFNAPNTYTGGTQLNGGATQTGTMALNVTGANGGTTVAIPAGDLQINQATVRLDQASQIHNSVVPELRGAGVLNLNNFNQTLAGLTFINDGSSTAAAVTTGTGILTLTGNITASSSNVGSVANISGGGTGGIAVDLNGATRTLTVNPVTVNGNTTVANATPTLAISSPIGSSTNSGTTGLIKAGDGLLQLSGTNLFGGGVTVNGGGLVIGASTNVTTRDGVTGIAGAFASGPLGTGVLTINANGTVLASTGANTLNNDYAFGTGVNNLTYRGLNSLTLNGATTLQGNTTITVEAPQGSLLLNGAIGEATPGFSLTKEGLGTLTLGGNNTFSGGVTVNAGTLALAGLNNNNTAPVFGGTVATIGNGGLLSLVNSGTGSNGLISYANDIAVSGSLTTASLFVGNNGGGNVFNTIEVPNLTLTGGQILNVSSANNYSLRLLNVSGDTAGGPAPQINPAAGTRVIIFGFSGDRPVNVGQGELIFPDLVTIGTSTTLGTPTINLSGAYPLGVQSAVFNAGNVTSFGYANGGLNGSFATIGAGMAGTVSPLSAGIGFTSSNVLIGSLGDGTLANRPPAVTGTAANTFAAFTGLLEVPAGQGGSYTFRSASDDGFTLFINGVAVYNDTLTFGHALQDAASVTVNLPAGFHTISYKVANSGSGGGYRLLYSGPDTGNRFQGLDASRLYNTTARPTAANGFNGAAIINNDYALAASTSATIDTFSSQFGAVIDPSKSLTIGNNAQLNIVNGPNGSFATGWFGAAGPIDIGTGAILNTGANATASAGMLYLLGNITATGTGPVNGLTKSGVGTLVLGGNNTGSFTGDLNILGGVVQLDSANALPAGQTTISYNGTGQSLTNSTTNIGSTTVTVSSTTGLQKGMLVTGAGIPAGTYIVSVDSSNAYTISAPATANSTTVTLTHIAGGTLDLNGVTGVAGNVTIAGFGNGQMGGGGSLVQTNAALWNSRPTAASLAGSLTVTNNATIGGTGNISLAAINMAATSGTNPITLTKVSPNTLLLGNDTTATFLAPFNVTSGQVRLGSIGALGATTQGTTIAAGAVLDLNGFDTAEPLTVSGAGFSNVLGVNNTLGSIINTGANATISSNITLGAATSIGSSYLNPVSGGSVGGNITISGVISGGQTLTKVGENTLTLTGVNTNTGLNITRGAVVVSGNGVAQGSGATASTTITVGPGTNSGLTTQGVTLTFDNNVGVAVSGRAGTGTANRSIVLSSGAELLIRGNATTAVTEALNGGSIQMNNGYNLVTLVNNGANITISGTGTDNATLTRANLGTAFVRGTNLGQAAAAANNTNIIAGGAAGFVGQTATSGANTRLIPWLVGDTSATSNGTTATTQLMTIGTNGFRPLSAAETTTTFGANNNIRATSGLNAGTEPTAQTATVINSLTLETGGSLAIGNRRTVTLDSGAILSKVNTSITSTGTGFSTGAINAANGTNLREFVVHTMGSTVLTSTAPFGGANRPTTAGLTKSGDGTLLLNSAIGNHYTGTTSINLGTLQIGAASPDNALFYLFSTAPAINAVASAQNANALVINAGGVFDLNGKNQATGDLLSRGALPGTGGIVTNTAVGSPVTYTTTVGTNRDFAGGINGNLNFVKTGTAQLTLRDNNTFTGNATFMGNVTALFDQGRFSGMAAGDTISVRNAVLRWDDTGVQALNDRISSAVAIELDGGTFEYFGRGGGNNAVTIGNLNVIGGTANLRVGQSTAIGFSTLTLGGTFNRSTGATLNAVGGGGVLGANPLLKATSATLTTNTNGIIGGWATISTADTAPGNTNTQFAVYDPALGIRAINLAEMTSTFATSTATSNLRLSVGSGSLGTVPSGGLTINSLTTAGHGSNTATIGFSGTNDTLTLASGGLIAGNESGTKTIGTAGVRGRLTTGGSELFIHNAGGTLQINSDITGTLSPVFTSAGTVAGAQIQLLGANSYTGTAYANGVILALNSAANSNSAITGDLTITGGTTLGTDAGAVGNSRVFLLAPNQIADLGNVTVRGGSQLDLNGFNETINNVVFNSQGGYRDGGPLIQTGAGTLTISGNVTATSLDDIRAVPTLAGNVSFGGVPTITVDRVAGASLVGIRGDINEQVGLALNASIVGGTTINKAGLGALQLGGVSNALSTINVNAGSVVLGGGSNYVAGVNLANGTILDLRGQSNLQLGTITSVDTDPATSTAIIKNFSPTANATLITGGSSDGTFAGTLASDYFTGILNVTKIGTGNWTLARDNSSNILGNLQVSDGTVTLSGTQARVGFVQTILAEGGTLTLDNSTNAVSNRLGGTTSVQATSADRLISNRGGILNFLGGSTAVTEALNGVTNLEGASRWNLTAGTAGTTINIATFNGLSGVNRGTLTINVGSGQLGGATAGSGRVNVIVGTPNLVGNIRPDMIGIQGSEVGLVTHDANGFRLLTPADTALGYFSPAGTYLGTATPAAITAIGGTVSNGATTSNVNLTSAVDLHASTTINSLNLSSGGGLTSLGGGVLASASAATLFNAAGAVNTLTLGAGGAVLAETGNLGITGGALTAGGNPLYYHAVGDLTTSAYTIGTGPVIKSGAGILNLNRPTLNVNQSAFFVNEGTVNLNAGTNTLLVTPTATTPTAQDLIVNGGTLNLNGNSQAVARLTNTTNANFAVNAGTVTNTGAMATLTVNPVTSAITFSGAITGAITLDKVGTIGQTLTSASTYTGATNVRGGTLLLQDAGAITGGGAVNLNYATLSLVNSGLNHVGARTGTSALNFNGGTLSLTPRLEGETSASAGAVGLASGQNTITIAGQPGLGGSLNLTAGALTRTAGSGAVLLMNSATGQIGRGTTNNGGQSGQVTFSSGTTLTNGILGGWALATNGVDFLTYLATPSAAGSVGVGLLGDTSGNFPDYTTRITAAGNLPNAATNNTLATGNFNTNVSGNTSLNSLAHAVGANGNNLTYTAQADTLTLTTGGYARSGAFTGAIGQNVDVGRITSSGNELFIHNAASTLTINSAITGATVTSVFSSVGGGTIALANGVTTRQFAGTAAGTNLTVASTAGMFAGQTVTGPGFTGTVAAVVDGTNVTLSAAPTAGTGFFTFGATGTAAITGATNTSGSPTVTFTTARPGLFVGQPVFGAGVPLGATISAISADGLTVTLSANSTAAVTAFTAGSAGNTYGGGTIVNNGATLQLNSARPGEIVVPAGGLTINGGAVTMGANIYGAIAPTTAVTINGAGSLTYPTYAAVSPATPITNTLASLTFNNNGGTGTPTLALGTPAVGQVNRMILTAANAITAVNDNYASTPTISGTFTSGTQAATLEFSNASPVINVSGSSPMGLIISAAITQNAGNTNAISKTGTGSLILSNSNSTWSTGLALNAGTLVIAANSTPTTVGTPVTSGPLGTGTLTIANGTTIQTGNTAQTISNAVVANGNFTVGGTAATHNLTLNGTLDLGGTARTITVTSPQVTASIGGVISNGGLVKAGDGILTISNTGNSFTGNVTVDGGLLQLGAAGVIPDTAALAVNAGGAVNVAGFAETVASLSSASSTTGGLITNSGAAANLTISNTTGSTTFGGSITNATNALNVVKSGDSTQVFSGQNTYSGTTTVNGGILGITNNLGLGLVSAGTTVASGASLQLSGNITVGAEALTLNGSGFNPATGALDNLSGTNTYGGAINVATNSTIRAANGSTLNLGGAISKNGTVLTLSGAGTINVNGVVSGALANSDLIIDGSNTTLNAANTYNGPTIVRNGGTLTAAVGGALPTGTRTAVTLDDSGTGDSTLALGANQVIASLSSTNTTSTVNLGSSTLTVGTTSGSTTFAGDIVGTGGLTKDGASSLNLSGANTYTGPTQVSGGTLEISGSINSTSNITVDATGTLLLTGASNSVADAPVVLNGGTLAFGNQSSVSETFGTLTLTNNSILDFGSGDTNTFRFSGLNLGTFTLNVYNWTGNTYDLPPAYNPGGNQDRFEFTSDVSLQALDRINFFSGNGTGFLGTGAQINFGVNQYEIVPVPEPSSTALLGAMGLIGLIGYRERRRFARKSQKNTTAKNEQ